MKKITILGLVSLIIFISGCASTQYEQNYTNDTVYAIDYKPSEVPYIDSPGYTWGSYPWYGNPFGV